MKYLFGLLLLCIASTAYALTTNFTLTLTVTPVPTGITLSATSVSFPTAANAGSKVATVTVTTASGSYLGTLNLTGADAAKFTLSNGGVYPTNLMVGAANIPAGTYNVSITAP